MRTLTSLLFCVFFMLTACVEHPPLRSVSYNDDALIKLAEAADSVSDSLLELKRIQAASTPPRPGSRIPDHTQFSVPGFASVDTSGPIEPLVKNIAKAAHYKLSTFGKSPAIPIIITMRAKDTPIAKLLADIYYQAYPRARISVDEKRKTIRLIYARA